MNSEKAIRNVRLFFPKKTHLLLFFDDIYAILRKF